MKISLRSPLTLAGLSSIIAGICCAAVAIFHPENTPAAVQTAIWVNVHFAALGMTFFGMFAMAGLYIKQSRRLGWIGWIGWIGFIMVIFWFALVLGFSFIEALLLPYFATSYPVFVEAFLGMFSGAQGEIDLGVLPLLWNISGGLYILGPLLFGIATYRAQVFSRLPAAFMIGGALLTPIGAILPPLYESLILLPLGVALVMFGRELLSESKN